MNKSVSWYVIIDRRLKNPPLSLSETALRWAGLEIVLPSLFISQNFENVKTVKDSTLLLKQ